MLINNDLINGIRLPGSYQQQPVATMRSVADTSVSPTDGAGPAYILSLSGRVPVEQKKPSDSAQDSGKEATQNENAGKSGGKTPEQQKAEEVKEPWRRGKPDFEQKKVEQEIKELKREETRVVAHENAHKGAGGQYAGGINYKRSTGPDGRQYITGGSVSMDISEESSPQKTIIKMQIVKRAALAPADPSSQDKAVAASASAKEARARQALSKQMLDEAKSTTENGNITPASVAGFDKTGGAVAGRQTDNKFNGIYSRDQAPRVGGKVDLSA